MLLVTHDIDEAIYMSDRILIMTARPGQIEHCLDVPMPRPRQRNSPEFLNLRSEILELLHLAGAPSKPRRPEFLAARLLRSRDGRRTI
jgi:ABC-type nitrate/sulfonate/bicarbonate transport system ATPase subunit